ncbi:MAG: hypothetical protein AAFR11_11895 [Pseudomonadota bacterium]
MSPFAGAAGLARAPADRPLLTLSLIGLALATMAALLSRSGGDALVAAVSDGRWAIGAMSLSAASALLFALHDRDPRVQAAAFAVIALAWPLYAVSPIGPGFGGGAVWLAAVGFAALQVIAGPMIGVGRALFLAAAAVLSATLFAGALVAFLAASGVGDAVRAETLAAALALALAAGAFTSSEFADRFARGARAEIAAGQAAQASLPVAAALFIVFAAGVLPDVIRIEGGVGSPTVRYALGGLALGPVVGVFATASVVALIRPGEAFAEAENRRVRTLRSLVAAARSALSIRIASAVLGVAGVVAVVGLVDAPGEGVAIALSPYIAAILAGIIILASLRTAAMIAIVVALALAGSAFVLRFAPRLEEADAGLAVAFAAAPVIAFAQAWRGEVTSRRSARDIAEHALVSGFGRALWIALWTATPLVAALADPRWGASAADTLAAYVILTGAGLALGPFCGILLAARAGDAR